LAVFTCTALVLPLLSTSAAAAPQPVQSDQLQQAVTLQGVMRHLERFEQIALANDGNRAAGTPGYDRSATYVANQLRRAGYRVQLQPFSFESFEVLSDPVVTVGQRTLELGTDFNLADYSGSGEGVTGPLVAVDVTEPPGANTSTSGCEASDFAGFPTGAIAVLQRGTCAFGVKAQNAANAGAVAAIIYNEGTPGDVSRNELLSPTLGEIEIDIPVIGVSYALGRELLGAQNAVTITAETEIRTTISNNVIAETRGGRADNVVMLGGHLDSVDEGPGINDNGTGTAALLEAALQLAKDDGDRRVNNTVRFAFWSAEESGLIGSTRYVESLSATERSQIALYLNFDMVGSPNYFRGVYDGTGDLGGTVVRPPGSAQIETMFNLHFTAKRLPFEDTEFSGRSDYQAFINAGIPSGGLFTGAEDDKTADQVRRYGGIVADYDPCYHQACDSFSPLADGADAAVYSALQGAYGSGSSATSTPSRCTPARTPSRTPSRRTATARRR
jgi:Zn-dependent M28 family amino/carboxypeptidase